MGQSDESEGHYALESLISAPSLKMQISQAKIPIWGESTLTGSNVPRTMRTGTGSNTYKKAKAANIGCEVEL